MNKIFIKALIERKANGGYSVLASTSAIDRQGDSIAQDGWDLRNFMKNPVMLWAHDYSALPIAKATSATETPAGLVLEYEFAPAEGNPMAANVKNLVDGGFLNAVSVGFMPLERNGNKITKMELLEVSFVPVPANPQALQLMLSKGIAQDVISKFFEVKDGEIVETEETAEEVEEAEPVVEEKGAIADEINEEEEQEKKWCALDPFFDIINAFMDVYLDEATPSSDWGKLLLEVSSLIAALAATAPGAEDEEDAEVQMASFKESLAKAIDSASVSSIKSLSKLMQKMGAKHSSATLDAIKEAIGHSDAASSVLKDLVDAGDDEGGEDEADAEIEEDSEKDISTTEGGVDELRSLLITRELLRKENTPVIDSLTAVNSLIKSRAS